MKGESKTLAWRWKDFRRSARGGEGAAAAPRKEETCRPARQRAMWNLNKPRVTGSAAPDSWQPKPTTRHRVGQRRLPSLPGERELGGAGGESRYPSGHPRPGLTGGGAAKGRALPDASSRAQS